MTDDTIYIALTVEQRELVIGSVSNDTFLHAKLPGDFREIYHRLAVVKPLSAEQVARQWLKEHGDKIDVGRIDASDVAMVGQMWWVPDAI